MYGLARNSQASKGSPTRGHQDDDDLKVPALPDHAPRASSQKTSEVEDRKMPAASTPGAVAAPPTARDPAAVKQAAARDPARLSHASPHAAHSRSEAHRSSQARSSQARRTETDEDIKQRYRSAGATDEETPGAKKVAGIEDSTEFLDDDNSYDEDKDKATESMATVDASPLGQEPTITAQLAPTDDEVMKRFVEDIPVAEAEVAPSRKRWIIIGGIGVLACAGLGAGLGVALSGDDSSPPTAPPTTFEANTCLESNSNPGTFTCVKEEFPSPELSIQFQGCPTSDEERVFECSRCAIGVGSDITDLNEDSVTCNGCIICDGTVSFDCTNLAPENECALQTCSGKCGKDPVPSPSPDTQADLCFDDDAGTLTCAKEDIPFDFLLTLFGRCPPGVETNVYECQVCVIVFEDTLADIDADTSQVCNGCINCGDSLAFDCSNLFPGEKCSAVDCDGNCFGDRQA